MAASASEIPYVRHPVESPVRYAYGPDSYPQQPGVPQGVIHEYAWSESRVFPGTDRRYWIYVPAQYIGHPGGSKAGSLAAADDDCLYDRRWNHEPDWRSVRDDQPPSPSPRELDERAPAVRRDAPDRNSEAVARDARSRATRVAGHAADDVIPGLAGCDGDQLQVVVEITLGVENDCDRLANPGCAVADREPHLELGACHGRDTKREHSDSDEDSGLHTPLARQEFPFPAPGYAATISRANTPQRRRSRSISASRNSASPPPVSSINSRTRP